MVEDTSPAVERRNSLQHTSSSYLRSAQHQPVEWRAWNQDAFDRAEAENKPILLDIGAVWCHWCHVMDRESYEDPELARIINDHYIAIKVDRDERPDVDARYQAAISAISGQGGWPLTAFLTPDGRPFFGGTYFPRDDRYGRPGFGRVLLTMSQVWKERRDEALESASSVMAAIEHNESFSGRGDGRLTLGLVDKIAGSVLAKFDPRNGGFGAQPKFPHPAALDLLLEIAMNRDNEEARNAFLVTLEKMAQGGVYDHLAGGFHRYSVDERWVVPHFEKMLYDNTELLRNYVHGFQSFVREDFRRTALEIVGWLDSTMTDRERGGFYASQDADIDLDDDGDYFTWTLDEARAELDADELAVAAVWFDIGELGDMHHNPSKNVLHIKLTPEQVARQTGKSLEQVQRLIHSAKSKLLAARRLRPTPFIDRTLYTSWNAMAVRAYFEAGRVLRLDEARDFALLTLKRLLDEAWDGENALAHVIAYPDSAQEPTEGGRAERVAGTLDDYAFTVHACIDGWFASGRMEFYYAAVKLADAMIARFYDRTGGAFYDTANVENGSVPLGVLGARRKPLQDAPTPAGNPTAASALLRLEELSGKDEYREIAEDTLSSFAGIVEHFGLYAGSYGLALEELLLDPVQVVIVGSGPEAVRLEAMAVARYAVNKTVTRIGPWRLTPGGIPDALAEMLLNAPAPKDAAVWAIICRGRTCLPPVTDSEELLKALAEDTVRAERFADGAGI